MTTRKDARHRAGGGDDEPDDPVLIAKARALAKKLLRKELPERWLHTQGVATRAAELATTVAPEDRSVLIAAAWLHDIGYSPALRDTGFHPLDGGLYLRAGGWDGRLAALVAHHSGARFVPVERGFGMMMAEFDFEDGVVSDALTYADQTVGPPLRPSGTGGGAGTGPAARPIGIPFCASPSTSTPPRPGRHRP